jgi:hypothetical protein
MSKTSTQRRQSKSTAILFVGLAAVWLAVSFLPFAFIGETWGSIWYLINYPLSLAIEGLERFKIVYLATVTLINGCVYSYFLVLLYRLAVRKKPATAS